MCAEKLEEVEKLQAKEFQGEEKERIPRKRRQNTQNS
jgi:hypothetical protein